MTANKSADKQLDEILKKYRNFWVDPNSELLNTEQTAQAIKQYCYQLIQRCLGENENEVGGSLDRPRKIARNELRKQALSTARAELGIKEGSEQ